MLTPVTTFLSQVQKMEMFGSHFKAVGFESSEPQSIAKDGKTSGNHLENHQVMTEYMMRPISSIESESGI